MRALVASVVPCASKVAAALLPGPPRLREYGRTKPGPLLVALPATVDDQAVGDRMYVSVCPPVLTCSPCCSGFVYLLPLCATSGQNARQCRDSWASMTLPHHVARHVI